jgi:hypothetical protein
MLIDHLKLLFQEPFLFEISDEALTDAIKRQGSLLNVIKNREFCPSGSIAQAAQNDFIPVPVSTGFIADNLNGKAFEAEISRLLERFPEITENDVLNSHTYSS